MAAKLARSQRTNAQAPDPGAALLKVGDLLAGKYRVERILGEGGMGVVVAAHHELLDQHVAVKLLYQDIADREAQSRLLLEARAAAKLQSEHVARVVDVDTGNDGLPFIVMELLDGADLCQIADARGALPRWLVVDYVLQALEGLAHAHARSIIHRDLKPSNLFLANRADGTQIIKILDFGISKSMEEQGPTSRRAQQLTGGRSVLGSPPYMSPEQVRSPKTVDHRTDIWSLGIVMYELLTNSMPFGGDQIQETFAQILEKQPQPIRQIVSGVPEGLERVVMRCMAKNRDERFSDVGELARALVPYGSGTWIQSADRIAGTLARAVDESQAVRTQKAQPTSMDRLPIPSAPGKRLDSMQPEFHGTASTVARRFGIFESHKTSILAGAGFVAFVGAVLIAGTLYQSRDKPNVPVDPATSASAEAPPEAASTMVPVGAGGITTPTPHIVGQGEGESPPTAPTGTVIGASPATPVTASLQGANPPSPATATTPSAKKPPPPTPPVRGKPTAPPPTPPTTKPSLPAGLPSSRT